METVIAFGGASSAMQESPASLGSSMQGRISEFGINIQLSEEKVHDHHLAKGKTRGKGPPRKRPEAQEHSRGAGS